MNAAENRRGHERHRQDRQIEDVVHDAYRERYHPPEPAVCPTCAVVYEHGAYHWKPRPEGAQEHVCPACRRIADRYPAGYLTLEGEFFRAHRDEIMGLVHNEAARAQAEHPLERIIGIEEQDGRAVITTTDVHLPRRIGDALHRAYRGESETKYARDEYQVRVRWSR
ncbi:MAG TPA: BCAM0308 family protein [Burkholderiales bacterium]|nr:BCAM0308 family protein [Burkholderiales bacterium]